MIEKFCGYVDFFVRNLNFYIDIEVGTYLA